MEMTAVRGRRANLQSVGWENFFLEVEFRGGRRYRFGGVPEEVCQKLLRTPFPDALFQRIVRRKYVSERVYTPPSTPVPRGQVDYDDLPF